ncbi:MAG: hypothetical protein JWM12_2519 [Ilumatobacteraceae bacterium]|nr:hypothetical protein [Ilumatobacteraceae bacterium]
MSTNLHETDVPDVSDLSPWVAVRRYLAVLYNNAAWICSRALRRSEGAISRGSPRSCRWPRTPSGQRSCGGLPTASAGTVGGRRSSSTTPTARSTADCRAGIDVEGGELAPANGAFTRRACVVDVGTYGAAIDSLWPAPVAAQGARGRRWLDVGGWTWTAHSPSASGAVSRRQSMRSSACSNRASVCACSMSPVSRGARPASARAFVPSRMMPSR